MIMMDNNTHTYDGQIKDRYLSLKILDNKYLVNNITYEQALLEIYNSTSDNTVHQIIQKIQNCRRLLKNSIKNFHINFK